MDPFDKIIAKMNASLEDTKLTEGNRKEDSAGVTERFEKTSYTKSGNGIDPPARVVDNRIKRRRSKSNKGRGQRAALGGHGDPMNDDGSTSSSSICLPIQKIPIQTRCVSQLHGTKEQPCTLYCIGHLEYRILFS
jgi:hypothetical protein